MNQLKKINPIRVLAGMLSAVLSWQLLAGNTGMFARGEDTIENTETTDFSDFTEQELSYEQTPVSMFRVGNLSPGVETDMDYTDWWYSGWDNCHYLFLPATADRMQLELTYAADGMQICLDDTVISSGEMTDVLGQADTFRVTVDGIDCGMLRVMQSNLGCIYLATSTGGLDALDANRGFTETATALMLNERGGTEYAGEIEKITDHGNSSWDYSAKKPYNIKLPQKANLYGMGKAKKWALLGNYLDHSMLRNKMTLELSRAAGMEYVMDSVFVDLYADGSYRGTYQLSERIQVQKNRVNIYDMEEETEKCNDQELSSYERVFANAGRYEYTQDCYRYYNIPNNPADITGGYLMEFKMPGRYFDSPSGFVTTRGQAVEIRSPEYATEAQVQYIRKYVQELEDAIYSPTGFNSLGKHYSDYMDVDSFLRAYLIEEISMDVDSTAESFYLWKDADSVGDGKIHFGPVWDFDFAYNNFSTYRGNWDGDVGYSYIPDNLFAAFYYIAGYNADLGKDSATAGVSWAGTLYKRGTIVKRVAEIYFEDFYPYLCTLTDTEQEGGALLTRVGEELMPSAEMNNARWHMYGHTVFGPPNGTNYAECVDFLRNFTWLRKNWLAQLWMPLVSEDAAYKKGDVNLDGRFNQQDVIMLQAWLHSKSTTTYWKAADFNEDGEINIYDLCLMKQALQ